MAAHVTAAGTADILVKGFIQIWDCLESLLSDNDRRLRYKLLREVKKSRPPGPIILEATVAQSE